MWHMSESPLPVLHCQLSKYAAGSTSKDMSVNTNVAGASNLQVYRVIEKLKKETILACRYKKVTTTK